MFHKLASFATCLLLLVVTAFSCGPGELTLGATCVRSGYIEGCYQYSGSDQCIVCEFNYDLIDGRCDYNPQSVEKCCVQFGQNGQCSQCEKGLFLDSGACKQAAIVGCLSKLSGSCVNCADGYYLSNGRCPEGIKRCNAYDGNGVCVGCFKGHTLKGGACIPQIVQNCLAEQNGICSKCQAPFQLSNGQCKVSNCALQNQYGCIQCVPNFYLNQKSQCASYDNGCGAYEHGVCVTCLKIFTLENGTCNVKGCATTGINGRCQTCKPGYQLSGDGFCAVPNCLHWSQDKCLICANGYHLTSGTCQSVASNCIDLVGEVCHSCAPGFFLSTDRRCIPFAFGCTNYSKGICVQCKAPFMISTVGQCYIEGCDQLCRQGCLTCKTAYQLSGVICKLPNCDQASNGLCTVCSSGYHLYNKQCVINDVNCQGYTQNGQCIGCQVSYHLSDANTCVVNVPGCVYTGSSCNSCSVPFVFAQGACSIPNCQTFDNKGCTVCSNNYYVNTAYTCTQKCFGGVYVGGVLQSCYLPFVISSDSTSCKIEGCTIYNGQGCATCLNPYMLTAQNTCQITNCLRSGMGQCLECISGFKVINGLCILSIGNCLEYNANGCQTCSNLFYLTEKGKSCLPVAPGCIYSNGQCVNCTAPFSPGNGSCYIEGCSVFNSTGCQSCSSGFTLGSGKCVLPNCKSVLKGVCATCDDGFTLSNGVCKAQDKCLFFEANGTCKTCSSGFSINICGRCVPTVSSCAYYGKSGNCSECIAMYFLTKDSTCQMRNKGCKSYIAGVCSECDTNYFLYDGICFAFTQGCLKYSGKNCVSCSTGYTLSRGICLKANNKLSTGLTFGDDFCDSNACNSTSSSQGVDIDFDSVKAKNPASGAKIGTLFYSSVFSSNYNSFDLNSKAGWKAGKSTVGEWVGIQLSSPQTFYELQIQGGENGAYISGFTIEFSVDGAKFDQVPGVFSADYSQNTTVVVKFVPVYALAIRLVVKKFNIWPAGKFDFIYNNIQQKQDWAGLFSTNQINKKIYSIQSSRLSNQLDINIRQFFNPVRDCSDKDKCWSGIELCEPKVVTSVDFPTTTVTSGAITEFFVDYSLDGNYFSCYNNCTPITVSGSSFSFANPLKAKNVRIHPTKWTGTPEVQFSFNYS